MARVCKENINTSFFHIMVQGNNKEYIFNSMQDINQYMKIMKDTKEKIDSTILAYCIMNNHAHMLFYEENIEKLTKYMHRINMMYAKYYNKEHNRVGYVFRDRYKTQPKEYQYSSYNNNIFYTGTELEKNIRKNLCLQNENNVLDKEDQFVFMENEVNKEEICKELVEEIITKNHITKEELCQNEALLSLAIKKLKYENSISYRMMETILGVNRKKLKRMENSDS